MFTQINCWSSWKVKKEKNNTIIVYLKKVTKNLDKYIEDKNEKKYKKLEARVLKCAASSSISKNVKNY